MFLLLPCLRDVDFCYLYFLYRSQSFNHRHPGDLGPISFLIVISKIIIVIIITINIIIIITN